jgi:muramoyltetrapeptide carboxypeptidase
LSSTSLITRPNFLKKGGTIGIVAPAKPTDGKTLAFCIDQLQKRGFRTKAAPNLTHKQGIFAGDEPFRARAFMECWCDPEVDAVWCFHGGYGCSPLLNHLDFNLIREHPKIFIGMSDATALHIALAKECHLITFLGPTLGYLFSERCLPHLPFSENALFGMIMKSQRAPFCEFEVLHAGRGEGRLIGGNLALITALIGTPWQIDTEGKILVLEDVNEAPYRIDRMLCQLRQSGLLKGLAGVVLCSWQGCEGDDPTFALSEVFKRYFSSANYPVIYGFPNGHIPRQYTLPLNAIARLETDKHSFQILD